MEFLQGIQNIVKIRKHSICCGERLMEHIVRIVTKDPWEVRRRQQEKKHNSQYVKYSWIEFYM